MRAIILAGGKGSRLAPFTAVLPKPLMPVGDLSILEIVIRQLKSAGVNHVTIAVNHLASLIMAVFDHGERFGLRIDYSLEETPLGTAGPLSLLDVPDDDFIVMNGDILTDLDYEALVKSHRESGAGVTIATYTKQVKLELGVLRLDDKGVVTGYDEKPTFHYDVSMGIYVFSPSSLHHLSRGETLDLPDFIDRLRGKDCIVRGYRFGGLWLDIGNKEDFERSSRIFHENRDRFLKSPSG